MPVTSGKMNAREQIVCSRVKKLREGLKWTQADFATEIGITRERLKSIEYGRTPLRYDIGWLIAARFRVQWDWLLGYDALPPGRKAYADLPEPKLAELPKTALFTQGYCKFAAPVEEDQRTEKPKQDKHLFPPDGDDMRARALVAALLKAVVESWVCRLPDGCSEKFYETIVKSADSFIKGLSAQSREVINARYVWLFGDHLVANAPGRIVGRKNNRNLNLTKTASVSIVCRVMKNQWPALKRSLQRATAVPGAKSKLAKFLKVDLTRVSQWLTEAKSAREPGAEYALQMLYWVEHPELQK